MNTAAAAAVLLSLFLFPAAPGSVMLPLLEVVVLEDDEEKVRFEAQTKPKQIHDIRTS